MGGLLIGAGLEEEWSPLPHRLHRLVAPYPSSSTRGRGPRRDPSRNVFNAF